VAGDFFSDALPAAEAYLLMDVLHDWDDADAVRILANIRRAAVPGSRLIVIERSVSQTPERQYAKVLDILMLVMTGGRERMPSEFETLFEETGFRLVCRIETGVGYSVIEAAAI
jgi:hypothetical protein